MIAPASAPLAQGPRALSLDATLGGGYGFGGGELYPRGGVALDALIGLRIRASGRSALLAGISAGVQGTLNFGDVCNHGSRGQCLDDFPALIPVAALAGWEGRTGTGTSPGATLRVLVGPSYVRFDGEAQRGRAAGAQGRVDLATPPLGPVALVASLRGNVVPRFRDQTFGTWAAGLGLRLR
jgi:hypothetical protein